jgi:hypothetical protein
MSYQAITTRYFGPGNVKGSRVKATAVAGSVTLHWDDALNSFENHTKAAVALARKYEWSGRWYGGAPHHENGYVFVCSNDVPDFEI